ncbi:DNA helicase [Tanacetum coccineum]
MSIAFATNKASISNAWKRKITYPSLIARAEEPLSSRNIIRRSTLTSSNAKNRMRHFGGFSKGALNPEIFQGLIHVLDEHNRLVRLFRTARDRCNTSEIPGFKIRLYNMGGIHGYELPTSDILGGIVFESGPRSRTDFDSARVLPRINIEASRWRWQRQGKKSDNECLLQNQLHPRTKEPGLIFRGERLFQQYVVTIFCAIKQNRLDYIRKHENELRLDYLSGLYDAVSREDREGIAVGSKIMLPNTFTRGPRYMYNHYLDALAICRSLGNPQFFITFTCNVKWPEIKRYMAQYPELTPPDRADIMCRVFEQKVKDFVNFLKEVKTFGYVSAVSKKRVTTLSYTVVGRLQKELQDAPQIEEYISAEIPDLVEDPRGYKLVTELIMHGPCGAANLGAPCMQNGLCNKHFPNKYNDRTFFHSNGHTHYRRRDTRIRVTKGESRLDNCNVVPYNRALCFAFQAYINAPGNRKQIDEIQNYVDGRFICPYEACWRIFDFPIHSQEPVVQILSVHLENMQHVTFRERDRLDIIVNLPEKKKTTLTEWFVYNNENTDGRHLTYLNFPSEFVWHPNLKQWKRRQIITKRSLGRLIYVHPSSGDLFYFRMLLCHQKGCKSPVEVRTVNGHILPTNRAACEALGLLGDDKECDIALQESTASATSNEVRILFAQILIYCDMSDPTKLWTKHCQAMRDDIPAKISKATGIPNYHVNTAKLQEYILYELEAILNSFGKSVKDFGLPDPLQHMRKDLENKLLMEEKNYKCDLIREDTAQLVPNLNHDQKKIYDLIIGASATKQQELLFVYNHGGTWKTFLWKTIISSLWSTCKIVLAVALSGIASLLLPAGRTAHSRTLRDLMNSPNLLFGGRIVVLGGDFRQTLPVKKGAGKEELIAASIAESYLWWHFKICTLKENMRLLRSGLTNEERKHSEDFAKWLLEVGNGEIGEPDEDDDQDSSWIAIPPEYSVSTDETGLSQLIDFIYDDATLKIPTAGTLQEKAIVETSETELLYPMEYLNIITFPGFPPHELELKVGSPIMLLRNVNLSGGLCNGTKMIVRTLMSKLIEAKIITGIRVGEKNTIEALRIGQPNVILEAKVYWKWISKSVPDMKELAFRCILIDKELASRVPYRDEKLKNDISTPNSHLRMHFFSCSGNNVELRMWDELATHFNKQDIENIPPPVIIAVSSCRVTKFKATSATHYYINPQTTKAEYAYRAFKEKYALNPPLQVSNFRCEDLEQEKTRNRQTLHTLLQQNPTSFKKIEAGTIHRAANAIKNQQNKTAFTPVKIM